mgnify:CR=1 FL=1
MVVPALLSFVAPGGVERLALLVLPWASLALCVLVGLAVVYRFGPDRRSPRWVWVTPGALLATLLWIAGSAAFSLYVSHFGRYDQIYGSIGAVVVLLLWLYLGAWIAILGAELNAAIERRR